MVDVTVSVPQVSSPRPTPKVKKKRVNFSKNQKEILQRECTQYLLKNPGLRRIKKQALQSIAAKAKVPKEAVVLWWKRNKSHLREH